MHDIHYWYVDLMIKALLVFFYFTVYSFCWYNSQGELSFMFIGAMTRHISQYFCSLLTNLQQ